MIRLLLVDVANVVMRCAFGGDVPPERAVPTAIGMVRRAAQRADATHLIACYDSPGSTWRRTEFAEYKANRKVSTLPFLLLAEREMAALGWYGAASYAFEADDVIATLAHRAVKSGADVVVLSSDSDLLALLALARVRVAAPASGGVEWRDAAFVRKKYGVEPAQLADLKALTGEPGDNVPGVPGIGPKKGVALLAGFGGLEALLTQPPVSRDHAKVREHAADARRALRLVTLRTDATIPTIAPATCALPSYTPDRTAHHEARSA